MLSLSLPKLAPSSVPLSPACHTHQLAIIGEGEAEGVKVQTDLVLSRRLGGEGEAALRAVLMGQKILEEAVSSEHRWPGTCFQERNSGAIPIQAPTGQARDEGVGKWHQFWGQSPRIAKTQFSWQTAQPSLSFLVKILAL